MKSIKGHFIKVFFAIFHWVVFFVYSQSIILFFDDLNSLRLRFSLNEILGFLSYQFFFSLFESLVVAAIITVVVLFIPLNHVKNNASTTGAMLVISFTINLLIYKWSGSLAYWLTSSSSISPGTALNIVRFLWVFSLAVLPSFSILASNHSRIKKTITELTENLALLGNAYIALSVLSIFIVIFRNLP